MKKLFYTLAAVFTVLVLSPQPASAADVRTGDHILIPENQQNLKDLYLFGHDVEVNAPVTNDVVAAGGNVTISGTVSNSVTAAGGTVALHGKIGNTLRVAGGTITIDGPINNDVVVAGGNVTIGKNASIGGDLMIAGGQLQIDGPVHGKLLISGGDVILNNTVGSNVSGGNVGTLTLGPQAKIKGNLTYSSKQQVTQESGSSVAGKTIFHRIAKEQEHERESTALITGAGFYQLIVGIILSILALSFFRKGISTVLTRMSEAPWISLGIGFVYFLLAPLASVILLILFLLGIASFFAYVLILIISMLIADIFVGWLVMNWWSSREKKRYVLDWKAGVIGPLILYILSLLPILGWFATSIIFLIAVGALVTILLRLVPQLQGASKKQ